MGKEYRGEGKDHGSISRPNVKEKIINVDPRTGRSYEGYGVRKAFTNEIPK